MNFLESKVLTQLKKAYKEKFGNTVPEPRFFRSPGRINLIGEHTDYNNGFVLPAGVDKAAYFAIAPRDDNKMLLYAMDLDASYQGTVSDLSKPTQSWAHYQLGIVEQLQKRGLSIKGFQAAFGSDIPSGAGLSSSAALECGLLYGLNEIYALGLTRMDVATMSQMAENEYVGVKCGIMDQFASAFGKENSVIRLDCRSLEYEYFPFETKDFALILCDTKVKHSLANSEYNTRRLECEKAVSILAKYDPSIKSLRDASPEMIDIHRSEMGDVVFRRAKFMTQEILRVQEACNLLIAGDFRQFGKKMYATHDGLQNEYEVSCPELDFLVREARTMESVLGSRMMGGGFGGCTINLVVSDFIDQFEIQMKARYFAEYGIELPCYSVKITEGTQELV